MDTALFTTDGRLLRNQSKLMDCSEQFRVLNRPLSSVSSGFLVLVIGSFDCPAHLNSFSRLTSTWSVSRSPWRLRKRQCSLVAVSTQLTVFIKNWAPDRDGRGSPMCGTLDVWLRRYQIGERLGDKFAKAWTGTCRPAMSLRTDITTI